MWVDKVFKDNLKLLMTQPWEDVKRPHYNDGESVKVKRLLQVCNQYDLRREFPISMIRPLNLKGCIKEILAIFQKRSCNIDSLGNIWLPWSTKKTSNRIIRVKPVILSNTNMINPYDKQRDIIDNTLELHNNISGSRYYCLEKDYKRRMVKVQFEDTGRIAWVSMSGYHSGNIKDPYKRTVMGIGYSGDYKKPEIIDFFGDKIDRWKNEWNHLFKRCGHYKGYENIFVHESFHSLERFLLWVKKNIEYRGDLSLLDTGCVDKDYFSSNCYSEKSCTILTHRENNCLKSKVIYVYKKEFVFYSRIDVARYLKDKGYNVSIWKDKTLSRKTVKIVSDFLSRGIERGDIEVIENKDNGEGYPRFKYKKDNFINKCYGYQIDKSVYGFDNQTDYVLHELRNNPTSRRIMTNMWNTEDNYEKSLLECAYCTMWSVKDGYLYMTLIQRSSDFLVSYFWNVAQYAALMMMFAHDAGLKPAILTHFIQDMHLYDRHEKVAEELLKRRIEGPIPQVSISMRMQGKGFYDFTPDDFEVWNYEPQPQVKFEVAV